MAKLSPAFDRNRRARIRATAEVVDALGYDTLERPEALNQHQLTRLAGAIRAGHADLILHALSQSSDTSPAGQWRVILPIIDEAEEEAREASRSGTSRRRDTRADYKRGRPRRIVRPAQD